MKGWTETILRVDLTSGKISNEPLDMELAHQYVGGRGLNAKMLFDEVPAGTDPLGPDNKLIIGVGPCNGTVVPGSQRFTVTLKSPVTGRYADSNSGGSFGATLKYAGYDMVIIEGKAKEPVYLWIDDENVEIRPAAHLWGKTTRAASRAIVDEVKDPDISTITIGPAGENMVMFASVIADLGRALGRTGIGAVFGSKNLKAISVRGTKGVKVADPQALEAAVKQTYDAWDNNREMYDLVAGYGPSRGSMRYGGMLGDKNFRGTEPTGWFSMMSLENQSERYVKTRACFSCSQGCDHMYVVTKGPFKGAYGEGMELSQPMDLGVKLGLYDLDTVLAVGTLGDELGLDYFDTSTAIAYAMECFEKGILTERDTGGLRLEWGNQDVIPKLMVMIANGQGIGDIFAQGLDRIPKIIGKKTEKYMMHAKGMTFPSRDPRSSKGWALMYAVSSRGPCHVRAFIPESMPDHTWDVAIEKRLQKYKDPKNRILEEGKPEIVYWYENLLAFKNSLEICIFSSDPWMFSESDEHFSIPGMLARFYNATTGRDISEEDVLRIGERIVNVERAFNVREGLTRKDDTLPERMLKEPMPDGFAKGQVVDLEPMLDEYYGFRGWDRSTGFPTRDRLLDLGLEEIADQLKEIGKLA
ncbi:MAG: aldehyde ferredoxin oxidoreductase family protein [Deltaproteobacteria bacterium]|nr:aldehyde ferredoxin oxidoreductase family protein [Deltaproteobacteria bacterium]